MLKGGSHIEDKVSYSKGEVITTDRDLAAKFGKHRFERLGRFIDEDVEQPVIKSVRAKDKKKKGKKKGKKEEDTRGLDVTEDFVVAKEAGYSIFEKENWFTVFDENGVLLTDKKLRKKDIPSFLEENISLDDEIEEDEVDEDEEPIQFAKGDRVVVEIDDKEYAGKIVKIGKDNKASVIFDDGDEGIYPTSEMVFEKD